VSEDGFRIGQLDDPAGVPFSVVEPGLEGEERERDIIDIDV